MRSVDPLITERDSRLAQPFPGVSQIFGEILRERGLGRRPASCFPFLDPLLQW